MYYKFKTQPIKYKNTAHACKGEYLNFKTNYSLVRKMCKNIELKILNKLCFFVGVQRVTNVEQQTPKEIEDGKPIASSTMETISSVDHYVIVVAAGAPPSCLVCNIFQLM